MRIQLVSLLVDDQAKALTFYTDVLGFVKKEDIPMGEFRWLTVVSTDDPDGPELVLEPTAFDPAKTYQKALFDAGIPATAFAIKDIDAEYERLLELGVTFTAKPAAQGPVSVAVFEDTCGNLIQMFQT